MDVHSSILHYIIFRLGASTCKQDFTVVAAQGGASFDYIIKLKVF